jgi:hypothetical protein
VPPWIIIYVSVASWHFTVESAFVQLAELVVNNPNILHLHALEQLVKALEACLIHCVFVCREQLSLRQCFQGLLEICLRFRICLQLAGVGVPVPLPEENPRINSLR